jgi:hypothetical protein
VGLIRNVGVDFVNRFLKVGHTSKTSPTQELNQDVARQSGSWRQAIFNRVVTPGKNMSGKRPVPRIRNTAEKGLKR